MSTASGAGGTSQADANGQPTTTTPAAAPAAPSSAPTTAPAASGDPTTEVQPTTPPAEEAISPAKAKELAREAQTLRATNRDLAAKVQEFERAAMTETQRLTAERDAALTAAAEARAAITARTIQDQAKALGALQPELVYQLLSGKLEYNAAGEPTNAAELVRGLLTQYPNLADARAVGGSPTAPARGTVPPQTFTPAQLADVNFYAKNEAAILAAIKDGRIKDD